MYKEIVSHELNTSNNHKLEFKNFKKVHTQGILLPSDRGYQHTSKTFKMMLG